MNRPEFVRCCTHGTSDNHEPSGTSDREACRSIPSFIGFQTRCASRCEKRFPRSEKPLPLSRCSVTTGEDTVDRPKIRFQVEQARFIYQNPRDKLSRLCSWGKPESKSAGNIRVSGQETDRLVDFLESP